MEIEFSGAAGEVTGSCHILRVNGRTIVLDCGLFQGKRRDSQEKNLRLPVPIAEIDAIILSHAHIDHAGRIPLLVRSGYGKRIFTTDATRDLCGVMLADSANIQEKDAQFLTRRNREAVEPLYTAADAARAVSLMVGHPYHLDFDVVPGVRARFLDAGHILGSAIVVLDCTEGDTTARVVFSGDIGRDGMPIIRDPEIPEGAHLLIMESTYGNREHPSMEETRGALQRVVTETAARGGRILIPAFALGRTQEVLYELHELHRANAIPEIPIFVDSPLAIEATSVFGMHPDIFDQTEDLIRTVSEVLRFPLVQFTRTVEESKGIMRRRGPVIVIAASGMAESGRILHHLSEGAADPRNTILIVGFQAEHTLGRRMVEGRSEIRVFGEDVPLRAEVVVLNGYSAHADRHELRAWAGAVRDRSPELESVWLVHGEDVARTTLTETLTADGFHSVKMPRPGDRAARSA